jgi:hypothetical protein
MKEKSTLRSIIRNETEFRRNVSMIDIDSLNRDLLVEKDDLEEIKVESKIIFGMLWSA